MTKRFAAISGIGGYVPYGVLTNFDLESKLDTSNEWIVERTGIKERRILNSGGTSVLAVKACNELLAKTNLDPSKIELLIMCTSTPDVGISATGSKVATDIGAVNAFSFDLNAACSGFLYGISVAAKFIESGRYSNIVIVGADKMSSIVNYEDRNTAILFGDGAGAVLMTPNEEYGVVEEELKSDGIGKPLLCVPSGSENMISEEIISKKQHKLYQEGKHVFKHAVTNMSEITLKLLKKTKLPTESIDWFLPHQANIRIINATGDAIGIDREKVLVNIEKYGNTTNATIPLLLWDYEKKFNKGDKIIFTTFGGGFTWGSMYLTWAY